MKPHQTAPVFATLAPAAALASPVVIIGVLAGAALLWLLSGEGKADQQTPPSEKPSPEPTEQEETETDAPPASQRSATTKRVTREDLAESLAYGEKRFTRKEAVVALEALGFRKTSAYKALSPDGKFGELLQFSPDGLIEWKG